MRPTADDDFEIIKQIQLVGNSLGVPKGHRLGFTIVYRNTWSEN